MDIFGWLLIYTFSLLNGSVLEILTLPDIQHMILSLFLQWELEKSFKFHTFFNISNLHWPFRQIGRIVNKKSNWEPAGGRRRECERLLVNKEAAHDSNRGQSGGRRLSIVNIEILRLRIVTISFKIESPQKITWNAKESHYLTFSYIWQSLAGNLKILPRSSR